MSGHDGSFIPPPFPFPQRWPQLFAQQQGARWLTPTTAIPVVVDVLPAHQEHQQQWPQWRRHVRDPGASTPTDTADEWRAESAARAAAQPRVIQAGELWADAGSDEQEQEFEYGFVLSDEWRARFRSSARSPTPAPERSQQLPRRVKNKNRKAAKRSKAAAAANARALGASVAAGTSRADHLQHELQAAKTRELARRWKRRAAEAEPPTAEAAACSALAEERRQLETELAMLFDDFCDALAPVVWPHDPLE